VQVALLQEIHRRVYRDTFQLRVAEMGGFDAHKEAEHHACNAVDDHLKVQIRAGNLNDNHIDRCETFMSGGMTFSNVSTSYRPGAATTQ
jgi:hypothetical protein